MRVARPSPPPQAGGVVRPVAPRSLLYRPPQSPSPRLCLAVCSRAPTRPPPPALSRIPVAASRSLCVLDRGGRPNLRSQPPPRPRSCGRAVVCPSTAAPPRATTAQRFSLSPCPFSPFPLPARSRDGASSSRAPPPRAPPHYRGSPDRWRTPRLPRALRPCCPPRRVRGPAASPMQSARTEQLAAPPMPPVGT